MLSRFHPALICNVIHCADHSLRFRSRSTFSKGFNTYTKTSVGLVLKKQKTRPINPGTSLSRGSTLIASLYFCFCSAMPLASTHQQQQFHYKFLAELVKEFV